MFDIGQFIDIDIHPHIFKEYDLQVKEISKIKSIIKVEAQTGTYVLKKSLISIEQFEAMNKIINHLADNDFPTQRIIPNKYGDSFINTTEGLLYLTEWVQGKNLLLNDKKSFLKTASLLGEVHKLGLMSDIKNHQYKKLEEIDIKKIWSDSVNWLKKYQQKVEKQGVNTIFERTFLTYIPYIEEYGNKALEQLNNWIIEQKSIVNMRQTICHGKFHHRNIIMTNSEDPYLLDFDQVSFDTIIKDIVFFIRSYALNKEYGEWLKEWLMKYQQINPLLHTEKKLLLIFLLFPERIITLAKSYEQQDDDYDEGIYIKKLQIRWAQIKGLAWFVENVFDNKY